MRLYIKEANVKLVDHEASAYIINEFSQMKSYMLQNESHNWPEAIELIDRVMEKINKRAEIDSTLWEELWTNIGSFILDNKE